MATRPRGSLGRGAGRVRRRGGGGGLERGARTWGEGSKVQAVRKVRRTGAYAQGGRRVALAHVACSFERGGTRLVMMCLLQWPVLRRGGDEMLLLRVLGVGHWGL